MFYVTLKTNTLSVQIIMYFQVTHCIPCNETLKVCELRNILVYAIFKKVLIPLGTIEYFSLKVFPLVINNNLKFIHHMQ